MHFNCRRNILFSPIGDLECLDANHRCEKMSFAQSMSAICAESARSIAGRKICRLLVWQSALQYGSWMQQVAEPWLVLNLSGSPALLGLEFCFRCSRLDAYP